MNGRVSFIGAGPGAADLLTLRAARRIAEADVVLWAPSVLDADCVREHATADAELVDFTRVSQDEVLEVYRRAIVKRLKVVRLHAGDTALWGVVQEQHDLCRKMGLDVEIVPGVSTFSAAAAIVGKELTATENAQSMIMTRVEGSNADLPDAERIRAFARHGTTMAISLPAARAGQLVEELVEGGYATDTPVVIAYKTTWPDELTVQTTIGELERVVKQHKLWRHTLFLVGKALRNGGARSYAPASSSASGYRRSGRPLRAVTPAADLPAQEPAGEAETAARPAQPGSDVAWWAVRDWQETTRATSRTARRYRTARLTGTSTRVAAASKTKKHPDQVTLPVDLPEPAALVEEAKPKRRTAKVTAEKPAADKAEKAKAPTKTAKGKSTGARKPKRATKSS
ncbi:cobalt-precorrin-4/precorrin-4 C(11)-methyltransferase [Allokutzneria albata]|uniref:Precorrin-4/cobalt-precorrin-4 C11-methyltransferase n=1 Tax=Allokutzneria albata TaxID=211114 RepID=A0A1G9X8N2_ALLAB|nr:cobalt-precorrin-4/precorrin-4 C(11)-methyltransferase [Allokutzneria albata]SDM93130.1 precorrin-4/cobalt-precorrin-4 C11-methyltransferase [Allokutzneria albata]